MFSRRVVWFLLAFLLSSSALSAATISWNNAAGGNWGTAANWSPAQVPTSGDDVLITLPGTYIVNVNVSASAGTLTLGATGGGTQTLSIAGTTLSLGGASSVSDGGVIHLSAGTLTGGGGLTINSAFVWDGGSLTGAAAFSIQSGAMMTIGGAADKFINGRTIDNFGTVQWNQGRILFQNNAVLNNHPAALFDVRSDSTITSTSVGGVINNAGTLRKQVATGTTTIVQFITLANTGNIDILSGVLTPLDATLGAGTNITGTGFLVDGGTVSVTGAATLTGAMGVASGNLAGPSTLTVNGVLNWTGGSFAGNGTVDISASGVLNIGGGADKFLNVRTINNNGDIVWTQGRILFQNSGVLNNLGPGTFDIQVDETMTSTSVGGTINNAGLIVKSAGAGTATAVTFVRLNNNAGTIHVPSGKLTFINAGLNDLTEITGTGYTINGGTTTVTGTAKVAAGATALMASGTLNGAGTFRIEGHLDWTGGSMAGSTGTTLIADTATMHLGGAADKFIDARTIENRGNTTWADAGRLFFQNNALFINQLGATFDAKSDTQFTSSSIGGFFRNFGTFAKSAGAGTTTIVQFIDILNDGGTFDVTSGVISIDSTLTLANTSTFSGTGNTQVTGTINGTATIAGNRLVLLGNLNGTGTLTLTGEMAWNSGSMSTSGGTTNVSAGAVLNIGGAADKFLSARVLNNFGTVNWTQGRILFQNSSIFNNHPGALFDITTDSQFTSTSVGGTFNNSGTFRKSGNAGVTTIVQFIAFNNQDGIVDVLSGSIVVDSPMAMNGTNTFSGAGILKVTGTLSGTTTIVGQVELAGGTFAGSGIITIDGTLIWSSGTMSGAGTTEITSDSTLQITGTPDHFLSTRTLNNAGTTIWDGGRILFQNNGHFFNRAGALFEVRHDNVFTSTSVGGKFTNEGTFRKLITTGNTSISQFVAISSTNSTFDTQTGKVIIDSTITLGGTTTFNGAGTTEITGSVAGTGTIAGRLRLAGGSISGAGAITVTGTLDWISGQMTGSGTTSIAAGGILNIDSAADHFLNSRDLFNSGTVHWINGRVMFQNSVVFNNQSGGVFSVEVDSQFASTSVGGTFNNSGGTFTKNTAGQVTMSFVAFNNSGTLQVQNGIVRFENGFTQTAGTTMVDGQIQATSALQIQGGVLGGNGTISATVTNSGGNVSPGNSAGTLTITGGYNQGTGGTLTMEIEGAAQYDRLVVGGLFKPLGTLNIVSPYSPADGETFQIITFGTRSGDFTTTTGLNLGGGKSYAPTYGANDLVLTAVDDAANLFVSQTDAPDPVNEGSSLTYTITVTNGATTGATGVTMTDTLPATVSFVSANPSQGSCNGTTVINCTLGSLAAGDSATVDIVVTPAASGTITNVADVAQNEPDPNTANNTFSETTLVNGAPVATDDSGTTDEDTPVTIDVLLNDSDPNGDTLAILSFTQGGNGTVDCQGANCTYTPDANFNGSDSFTYTIHDPGSATDTATVDITVDGLNDDPVANDDAHAVTEDVPCPLNVLANDTDGDNDNLTLTSHTAPANGSVVCAANGDCTYTPNPNFNGTDSYTYVVSDPQNATDTGTVMVTVAPVNDDPVAAPDSINTDIVTAVTINVLINDTDADGDTLQLASFTQPAMGTVGCAANGDCTYTPAGDGTDSFSYEVDDGNGGVASASVDVTVVGLNPPPVAGTDFATTTENTPVVIDVLANDTDEGGDALTVIAFTQPGNGSVTCESPLCTYTPATGFTGTDTFDYTVQDTNGDTGVATVTVVVTATNEPPVAVDDSATTVDVVHIDVLANDSDPDGDPLAILSHTGAETGQVSCSETRCTYWAKRGFRGSDNFSYTIIDPSGATASATVRIEVVRENCPPTVELLEPAMDASVGENGTLRWTLSAADHYNVYLGVAGAGGCEKRFARVHEPFVDFTGLQNGVEYEWRVEAVSTGCPIVSSVCGRFRVGSPCDGADVAPVASIVAQATSGQPYTLFWTAVNMAVEYEVYEADNRNFVDPVITRHTALTANFTRTTGRSAQPFFYRVRAITNCANDPGPFSEPVRIVITPLPQSVERTPKFNVPAGSTQVVVQSLFIPGDGLTTQRFSIETDKPWLTVTPSSGLLLPTGILVQLLADPTNLPNGTITGTVIVTITPFAPAGAPQTNATSGFSIPVSINLVTPVLPIATPDATPPHALIIPSVGHLGGGSQWQSDVRVTNTSNSTVKYQLTFMPSESAADRKIQQTTIEVAPGVTTALDDIINTWFGHGALGEAAIGFLKIVPVTNSAARTVASSRTFNITTKGTVGQFIPALPFGAFVGRSASAPSPILSLQQIAQSAAFRTNVGLVEASNKPASTMVTVFDILGNVLKEIPLDLAAGQLVQLNGFLAHHGISVDDGRIEVRVLGGDGKVTAYASTVDNGTNDPLLVSAATLGEKTATRYVLPGAADLDAGAAKWRTDMRIFNDSAEPQVADVVLHVQGGEPVTQTVVIAPREVKVLDSVVRELFGKPQSGGAIHVNTALASKLVVTGRTYNQTSAGTFGLFVPAVTPDEATGIHERTLHIPQVEDSTRYRTNVGVAEVSGKSATIEVAVVLPDSKVTPTVTLTLAPNEFRQFVGLLRSMGLQDTYNARVTVRVIEGEGRVTAYGSIIDTSTNDPTYVPGL